MPEASLKARIQDEMKAAMRAGEKARLSTIRLIVAAIKQREIDDQTELDDAGVIAALDKMAKQRRESIEQYQKANRTDLADTEQAELAIIQEYLPQPLGEAEIDELIQNAIDTTGAASIKDMGKVMGQLKPQLQGRADMGKVSGRVKAKLGA